MPLLSGIDVKLTLPLKESMLIFAQVTDSGFIENIEVSPSSSE
jgi:hypothetical protein